jgi:hypothetical protein
LPKLTALQIALIHIYQGVPITIRKAGQLAQQASMQTGAKIYGKYRAFIRAEDRLHLDGRKRSALVKNIEAVLVHLTCLAKKQAEDELFKLK